MPSAPTIESILGKLKSGKDITPQEAFIYMQHFVDLERHNFRCELLALGQRFPAELPEYINSLNKV